MFMSTYMHVYIYAGMQVVQCQLQPGRLRVNAVVHLHAYH